MKEIRGIEGVPSFRLAEFFAKRREYCLLIPVLNEGGRLGVQLRRALGYGIDSWVDIAVCDGGSMDGCAAESLLKGLGVRALLVKTGPGRQGAQLRTGIWWALEQGYRGVLTIDGNNKDSIEHVPRLVEKLREGWDFVQGSRYVPGGLGVNTPLSRHLAVRLIHAPAISCMAGQRFTDTTNNFRGYSRRYLENPCVQPLRDVFDGYELLAYLSVRATQLGLSACEVPVARVYPRGESTPTKIRGIKGNVNLLQILARTAAGKYKP